MCINHRYSLKLCVSTLFQCLSPTHKHTHTDTHTQTHTHTGTETKNRVELKMRMCGCRGDTDLITILFVVIFTGYFLLYYFEYFFSIKNKNTEALNVHVVLLCTCVYVCARVCTCVHVCACVCMCMACWKLSNRVPSCWQWTEECEVSLFSCGHTPSGHAVRAHSFRAARMFFATCWYKSVLQLKYCKSAFYI